MQAISLPKAFSFCVAITLALALADAKTVPAPAASGSAPSAASDRAAAAALKRTEAAYQSGQLKDAEGQLNRLLKSYARSPAAEEAYVMLTDIALRQGHPEAALAQIARFRRAYGTSQFGARMAYYQGMALLRQGKKPRAPSPPPLWPRPTPPCTPARPRDYGPSSTEADC